MPQGVEPWPSEFKAEMLVGTPYRGPDALSRDEPQKPPTDPPAMTFQFRDPMDFWTNLELLEPHLTTEGETRVKSFQHNGRIVNGMAGSKIVSINGMVITETYDKDDLHRMFTGGGSIGVALSNDGITYLQVKAEELLEDTEDPPDEYDESDIAKAEHDLKHISGLLELLGLPPMTADAA